MSERFYSNLPLALGLVEITGPEARHLAQVCRLGPGDLVCLFNGDGTEYHGRVQSAGRHSVQMELTEQRRPERELLFTLQVAAPLPKGDRAQFLIEKLTELGATSYVPLLCERSIVDPGAGKLEKLARYVIEASKQCGRNVLMRIDEPQRWTDFLAQRAATDVGVFAQPGIEQSCAEVVGQTVAGAVYRAAVGPEGGLTEQEVVEAYTAGWRAVGLGPRTLRIETAALALACWFGAGAATRHSRAERVD